MTQGTGNQGKAWSGVFTEATDSRMEAFSESISFDKRMYAQDIAGSIAHARMLSDVGLLTRAEFEAIERELTNIKGQIERGEFASLSATRESDPSGFAKAQA